MEVNDASTSFSQLSAEFTFPVVVSVRSAAPIKIETEDMELSVAKNESESDFDWELETAPLEQETQKIQKPRKYTGFTSIQMSVLLQKYEEQKHILENTRFDDTRDEVRQSWRNIAKAVTEVGSGHKKTPSCCWKKLLPILLKAKEDRENSYLAESCEGVIQLKHAQIQLPKCDHPTVKNNPEQLGFSRIYGRHGYYYTNRYEKIRERQKRLNSLLRRKPTVHPHPKLHTQKCHFPNCNFAASDSEFLSGHYRKAHQGDPKAFKCTYANCGKSFRRFNGGLVPHREAHQGHFRNICETCGEKFVKREALTLHTLRTHTTNPTMFECSQCPRKFLTPSSQRAHERNTHGPKPCICPVEGCSAAFSMPHLLNQHQGRQHKDLYPQFVVPEETVVCEECGETFKNKYIFKNHKLKHQGVIVPKRFECTVTGCSYKTHYKQGMRIHIRNVHEITEKTFICTEANCESKFKLQTSLDVHKSRCHPPPGTRPKFICPTCGSGLASERSLQDHIKIRHGGERDFICTQCSRQFPTRKYLLRHKKDYPACKPKKPGPNAVYCQICQNPCSNNNGLKRHMILLHGYEADKPWMCDICGQSFPIRMYLTRHKKYWEGKKNTCAEYSAKVKKRQLANTYLSISDDPSTSDIIPEATEVYQIESGSPVEIVIPQEQRPHPFSMFLTTYQYQSN